MAAATDVQFFNNLNSGCPQLTNNWGCMINLLDACLVNGVSLPTVSSAIVATGGNITLNFAATHSVQLFQCVTLAGFTPSALNGKYRVIGVPTTTQLTLSSDLSAQSATAMGTAKISPLGYEIIFSATTKRVYRALNPTAQHPFIRVDESLSSPDGTTGVYTSTYAKYAMVGLLENMTHIDDFQDASKLQLPLDTTNLAKNWSVSGTGSSVVRGWSKWYWLRSTNITNAAPDSNAPSNGNVNFSFIGDKDAFYLVSDIVPSSNLKAVRGCGLFNSALKTDIIPNWFIASIVNYTTAGTSTNLLNSITASTPLAYTAAQSKVFLPAFNEMSRMSGYVIADLLTPDYYSGSSNYFSANNIAALEIPLKDQSNYLRGSLKHIYYNGKTSNQTPTIILGDTSMYYTDGIYINGSGTIGAPIFYLGEMS